MFLIKNSYNNYTDRTSFEIDVEICNNVTNDMKCKSEDAIKKVLDNLSFTIFYLQDILDMKN